MSHKYEVSALSSCPEPSPPLPCSGVPEKVGMDHRPIYVGNVREKGSEMGSFQGPLRSASSS